MPRGGKRPGAGRKPGSRNKRSLASAKALASDGARPLDAMLIIMRSALAAEDFDRALDAAKAAAPYVHQRFAPTDERPQPHPEQGILPLFPDARTATAPEKLGKKAQAQADAETAGSGTEWGDLLRPPERPN